MQFDLPFIWALIIGFGIIMYVILDGFDLGIGILFPWINNKEYRDAMMNSVAPLWDGNETWLVFGGACLYGAFPIVYSTLLPILYIPLLIMLGSLIFRGVAFEFRFKADKSRFFWNFAFSVGSTLAAFCQGAILGAFIQGFSNAHMQTDITELYLPWLTPFSFMTGVAVVFGYALLGSTWLIMKTHGKLQETMYHVSSTLLVIVTMFVGVVSVWTPFMDPMIARRWFSLPNFFFLAPLPIITLIAVGRCAYALYKKHEREPFCMSVSLFVLSYLGLGISTWPYIIPRTLTIWQAASDEAALKFLLVGAVILLPILVGYTLYSYHVFSGKVSHDEGYH